MSWSSKPKKPKFYVVWRGRKPGVYRSWPECQRQVSGVEGAKFKSFPTYAAAMAAYEYPELADQPSGKPKKVKYYVVWAGHETGIFTDWNEAKQQIEGFNGPKFQTFGSKEIAERAWEEGPAAFEGKDYKKTRDLTAEEKERIGDPIPLSLSVDAASNNTGATEYQGVLTDTSTPVFHFGPFAGGTNNIGEFLAIVHGLAYLQQNKLDMPIYSDSRIAMGWIEKKRANTRSQDPSTQGLIKRAEQWLKTNDFRVPIHKWETKAWGEIPADFGRK